ncbi:Tn3 family transposase [Cereibacter sphaeroides]|uniref:Tn3 family transposase n=1 Tax=Cereibacter sphaeroides TaxID=1063 RepID=UPI003FCDCDC8
MKSTLYIGRRGEIRGRTAEGRHYRIASLKLLAGIIIYRTTAHLGRTVAHRQNQACPPQLLAPPSPLRRAHILLTEEKTAEKRSSSSSRHSPGTKI